MHCINSQPSLTRSEESGVRKPFTLSWGYPDNKVWEEFLIRRRLDARGGRGGVAAAARQCAARGPSAARTVATRRDAERDQPPNRATDYRATNARALNSSPLTNETE